MKWLSLFSGIGGFDLALTRQSHEIVAACEIDKYARTIYARHFPGVKIFSDATKLTGEEFGEIDGICAGFPCQAFSMAGRRLGFEDTRGTLFYEIARIAKQKRPRYILLENVKGLLFHDEGRTFTTIIQVFQELGYDIEWQVIDSAGFVPQERERLFIIGHPRKEHQRIFPLPKNYTEIIKSQVRAISVENSKANGRRIKGPGEPSFTLSRACAVGVIVDDVWRYFTPTELERLQGFPDGWTEDLKITERKNCLGNAVTVPVVEYILERLK